MSRIMGLFSSTCVASKLVERVINADVLSCLQVHSVITQQHHGSLSRRSTSSNLLDTLDDWTLAIRDIQSVLVAYIDYAKAFDSVSHAKQLIKLRACGIAGNLLQWIESFLSNRSQQTRI